MPPGIGDHYRLHRSVFIVCTYQGYIAVPRAAEDPQLDHCWATPGAAALENT